MQDPVTGRADCNNAIANRACFLSSRYAWGASLIIISFFSFLFFLVNLISAHVVFCYLFLGTTACACLFYLFSCCCGVSMLIPSRPSDRVVVIWRCQVYVIRGCSCRRDHSSCRISRTRFCWHRHACSCWFCDAWLLSNFLSLHFVMHFELILATRTAMQLDSTVNASSKLCEC
jgi:hypothetical protein